VAIKTDAVGKVFPSSTYVVGTEKIREFAEATFDTNPLSRDEDAAKAAGFDGLVAPPMFAVVYASKSLAPAMFDPDVEINFMMLVHGSQTLEFGAPVVAGDRISTTMSVKSIEQKGDKGFYVFASDSKNQNGDTVSTGDWTMIVRGVS